jgi:4-diphosphocytidyl-2-C-methyl-D-erythritol kinase
VLVNPGRPAATGAVYRAYDEAPRPVADGPVLPGRFAEVSGAAAALAPLRNDLEAPAQRLEPAIGAVLAALRSQRETLLARMSGSGATCFALCASDEAAEALARRVREAQPGWWIKRCRLSAPITNS